MGVFFPLDSNSVVDFIICEIRGFPHQFPIAWENAAKYIKLLEPRKFVPIFSLIYGQIQISILWYTLLHGQYMVFPISF